MFCSKCGNLCDGNGVCTSCGNRQGKRIQSFGGKNLGIIRINILLIVFLVLELVCLYSPVVKIESELLNIEKQFGLFDFSRGDSGKILLAGIHFAAIGCLILAARAKSQFRDLFVLPSVASAVATLYLVLRVAIKKNELISTMYVQELLSLANVDLELTTGAILAMVFALFILAMSLYRVYAMRTFVESNVQEVNKTTVPLKEALRISNKDLKEFAVILAGLCVVTGILIAIPTVLQNMFTKSILGEWYSVDEETGRTQYVVFHQDNTCEIDHSSTPIYWEMENGKIILTEKYGQEYAFDYKWEGNNLVINEIEFTRKP